MPRFFVNIRTPDGLVQDQLGIEYEDLEAVYLDVYNAIPEVMLDKTLSIYDPLVCSVEICNIAGEQILDVPFIEALEGIRRSGR